MLGDPDRFREPEDDDAAQDDAEVPQWLQDRRAVFWLARNQEKRQRLWNVFWSRAKPPLEELRWATGYALALTGGDLATVLAAFRTCRWWRPGHETRVHRYFARDLQRAFESHHLTWEERQRRETRARAAARDRYGRGTVMGASPPCPTARDTVTGDSIPDKTGLEAENPQPASDDRHLSPGPTRPHEDPTDWPSSTPESGQAGPLVRASRGAARQ